MSAATYIGRVGGLAIALGVGAAVFSFGGVASADAESPNSASSGSARSDSARSDSASSGSARSDSSSSDFASSGAANSPVAGAATGPAPAAGNVARARTSPRGATRIAPRVPGAAAAVPRLSAGLPASARTGRSTAKPESAVQPSAAAAVQSSVATVVQSAPGANSGAPSTAVTDAVPGFTSVANKLVATSNDLLTMPSTVIARALEAVVAPLSLSKTQVRPAAMTAAPAAAAVAAPAGAVATASAAATVDNLTPAAAIDLATKLLIMSVSVVAQMGLLMALSVATAAPPSPQTAAPTLVLNGYNVVPNSPETITSFYGRWTYLPGAPSLIQGAQQFDLVDPATDATVGSFDALVSRGNGYNYQELLVTANDGTNVGTGAGQIPPVGSVIATLKFFPNLGWSYSAMPTESGENAISFKLLTPFGDFAVPISFDAAKGVADHTVDDRPMDLMNGYFIAPADPTGENITGTSGILPLFTTFQGNQVFSVYDSEGAAVGSFDGVFTTTWDIIAGGIGTQAVLVTANDGINVGTDPGQTPPVGSVYNIMYIGDNTYIYSSLPSPDGDVVSLKATTPNGTYSSPLTLINASSPPPSQPLTTAEGYTFVPVGSMVPSGVNGLPPREVQMQGYQQFDVYDSNGNRIGSVDADVSNQWDMFGVYSQAIMVTKVTEGTVGTGPGTFPRSVRSTASSTPVKACLGPPIRPFPRRPTMCRRT